MTMIEQPKAVESILVFFPKKAKKGSPYRWAPKWWIFRKLRSLMQSEPAVLDGYTILDGDGRWYDKSAASWRDDQNAVVVVYTKHGFAAALSDGNLKHPIICLIARIAQMSCAKMGHDKFFFVINDKSGWTGTEKGIQLFAEHTIPDRPSGIVLYEEILG